VDAHDVTVSHELRESSAATHVARTDAPPGQPPGTRSPALRTVAFVVVAAVSGAAAGAVVARRTATTSAASTPARAARIVTTDAASVAAAVAPAVVAIGRRPATVDQLFATSPAAGQGSGILIRSDGTILTTSALVAGSAPIIVRLGDGRTLPATVIARDPALGIALLKVEARDLPTAPLVGSDRLRVGDDVVALGDALALPGGPTVATGVVAARVRTVAMPAAATATAESARLGNLLEITNGLGAGYAGGPVVDSSGAVVGLATTAANGDRAPGFAIDIARVRDEILRIESGRAPADVLGVDAIDVTPLLARDYGLPVESGALIASVVPHSPAAAAGVHADDIVIRVGNARVATAEDLARHARNPSSTDFRVFVRRGTKTITLTVHIVH
jgi:serine protease Do